MADTDTSATNTVLLMILSSLSIVAGYAAAGLCIGGAIVINIIHNLLPVFVFILPIIIILFMAVAPIAYGLGLASFVGRAAGCLGHGQSATTGLIALFWALVGVVFFPYFSQLVLPAGEHWFDDILMPFVELMLGSCISFEWLAEPKPLDVENWIVYSVLGGATLLGILCALGHAMGEIDEENEEEGVSVAAD